MGDHCRRSGRDHAGRDVKGTRLAARGWTREGGDLYETIERLNQAGCQRYVVTDVASDGMLTGPNFDLLADVCGRTDAAVIASGGVTTLDVDGVEGAIIGTALYVGSMTLTDALAVANGADPKDL